MRLICLLFLACLLLAPPAPGSAQAPLPQDPELVAERFFTNPLNLNNIGDPFVLAADGQYFAFATSGGKPFPVWRSDSLQAFGGMRTALRGADWAYQDFWAPEVFAWQGGYVMLYSARRQEDQSLRVGIAFAQEPRGPYRDLGRPLFDFGYAAIDASLFVDDDGAPYLYYARDCSENLVDGLHESHIYGVRLREDLRDTLGEPVLLTRPDRLWELHSGSWLWNEGPALLAHQGRYYLFYSANFYASREYAVGYAVADHPLGPFEKPADNRLMGYLEQDGATLISGPGHNAFFMAGEELFTAYHTHSDPQAPSGVRQMSIGRAGFHADGSPYLNAPALGLVLRPLADLGLVNATKTASLKVGSGQGELLRDGDECTASPAYAWQPEAEAAWAQLRWDSPVMADCMLLYTPPGQQGEARLSLNAAEPLTLNLGAPRQPGEPLILPFGPLPLSDLRLELAPGQQLGEIVVLARP